MPATHRHAIVRGTIVHADVTPVFRTIVRLPTFERRAERVFLILAYAKNRKEDLTGAERAAMRKLTAVLAAES